MWRVSPCWQRRRNRAGSKKSPGPSLGSAWDLNLYDKMLNTRSWPSIRLTFRLVLQTINRRSCTISEKAPIMAFVWLKAPTSAFTFKTLLKHYAKWALTPRSLNVKLGPRRNYHKGRAAIRHYAN